MAELVGGILTSGCWSPEFLQVDTTFGVKWSKVSNSPAEGVLLQNDTGIVLAWGARPAKERDVTAWARAVLTAASEDDPLPRLVSAPRILHSGVAYSRSRGTLLLVSGRFGMFPIYLTCNDNGLWFANYPGLLVGRTNLEPDPAGLAQLLLFGHCFGHTTATKDLYVLQPAEVVRYRTGERIEWLGRFRPPITARSGSVKPGHDSTEIDTKLRQSVGACVRPDQTLLQMTGGLDSRLLLAAAKNQAIALMTFGEAGSTDVQLSGQLARLTNRPFVHLDVGLAEDQLDHWATLVALASGGEKPLDHAHTALPYRAYRQWLGWTLVNGNGGEFARAYWYDIGFLGQLFGFVLPGGLDNPIVARYLFRRAAGRLGPSLLELMRQEERTGLRVQPSLALRDDLAEFRESLPLASLLDDYYLEVRNHRFVGLGLQLGGIFFERAHPYFESELHDLIADLALSERLGSQFHREAIGRLAPDLLDIHWDKTGHALKEGQSSLSWIPARWKSGVMKRTPRIVPYVDYPKLLRSRWRTWFIDIVESVSSALDSWVPAAKVLQLRDEHLDGLRDHTRALGVLITFGIWARQLSSPHTTSSIRHVVHSDL